MAALETLLPSLSVSPETLKGKIDLPTLFGRPYEDYRLEIGFGDGEHLAALMERFPGTGFLGAEPYINGMSSLLKIVAERGHENIRVLMDDALFLVQALPDECLSTIYILNPDPWPKTRHHKRRIVNAENLDEFARVLNPGGRLVLATDVDELAGWMVAQTSVHPAFHWTARSKKDWETPPAEWIETRFARKGQAAGRRQTFLVFEKVMRGSERGLIFP